MSTRDGNKRTDRAVKIEKGLAVKAKIIADANCQTIGEYLSALLRPLIDRDFTPAIKKISAEDKQRAARAVEEAEEEELE
jgi:hypothetical protein